MQRDQLIDLPDVARAVNCSTSDRTAIMAAVAANSRLVAWCESQQLAAAQALEKLGAVPERVIAEASRGNLRDSERVVKRARTALVAPAFGSALAGGAIAAGHLDQLGVSLCRLDDAQQVALLADAPRLLLIAKASTPDEFGRTLRAEERRLATDDGMSRLERQRAAVRLHSRTDINSGMNIFTLTVDPVTGVMLHNKPTVDWGLPVEIPHRVFVDLFDRADIHPVIVRNGVVLHATGQLNLGRTTRLANSAQRRALRAMYSTCAMPGCGSRFDLCKIHHVHWWRNGGRTDLSNLIHSAFGITQQCTTATGN